MEWSLLYSNGKPPTSTQVAEYIDCSLWSELNSRLQAAYQTQPVIEYSRCSMQRGWNIKYKKSGKSLLCPVCQSKTRTMVREETVLEYFPLFCPKCKHKTIISVNKFNMTVMKEPVAQSQL